MRHAWLEAAPGSAYPQPWITLGRITDVWFSGS